MSLGGEYWARALFLWKNIRSGKSIDGASPKFREQGHNAPEREQLARSKNPPAESQLAWIRALACD